MTSTTRGRRLLVGVVAVFCLAFAGTTSAQAQNQVEDQAPRLDPAIWTVSPTRARTSARFDHPGQHRGVKALQRAKPVGQGGEKSEGTDASEAGDQSRAAAPPRLSSTSRQSGSP